MKNSHLILASLSSAALLSLSPVKAELIGYYTLDGDFLDSSGNANHGTLVGGADYDASTPAVLAGGQSVAFDGTGYGDIKNAAATGGLALTTSVSFTVSMWVNGPVAGNNDRRIFSEAMTTDNTPLFNVGTHNAAADGTVDVYVRNNGDTGHLHSPGSAFDETWHHVAFVGGSDGLLDLYIDGVFDSQFDYSAINPFTPDTTTIGGILRATPCCLFIGKIDEVSLWDQDLNPEQIALLAAGTSALDLLVPPSDADMDGLPDAWEELHDLATDDDGSIDINNGPDGDPDMDGSVNSEELASFTDPRDDDSDDDGLLDGEENNSGVYNGPTDPGSNPLNADTDGDDISDGDETSLANGFSTNPLLADTDSDGFSDPTELEAGTDPTDADSTPELTDGVLVAYWPMDQIINSGGTDFTPDVMNGLDLMLNNMTATNLVAGTLGNAFEFDGISTMLTRVNDAAQPLPICKHPAYTISFWSNVTGTGQNDLRLYSEASTTTGDPLLNIGTHNAGADGTVDLYFRNGGTTGGTLNHEHSITEAFDGSWRHVAVVVDDLAGSIQVYIDGVLDDTVFTYKDPYTPNVTTTSVGGILRANPSHWVAGLIDEVSVWKTVLSQDDITSLAAGLTPLQIIGGGSQFAITDIKVLDGGKGANDTVDLTWNSLPGRVYTLGVGTDLNTFLEVEDSIESQGETTTFNYDAFFGPVPGEAPKMFFRIGEPE